MTQHGDLPVSSGARSYIGEALPRIDIKRLLEGRGRYVDDISAPRLVHAAFVRSPYAHAAIRAIDRREALEAPGVVCIATGDEIAGLCKPWVGVLEHLAGMRSMPQYPLAIGRARWHGEPVAVVAAQSRAQAEDAAQRVQVEWDELPAVVDEEQALAPGATLIHPGLGSNLCYERESAAGAVDEAFARADAVVEESFATSRHTHVTLEPRSILADFNPSDRQLTVWHSSQVPHMMQWILARHFGLPETSVRVIVPDVGGSFGLKIHVYGDEMAAVALAVMLGRPVRFVADRLESFQGDFHARGHRVKARMAASKAGDILAIEIDDLQSLGPYAGYPRGGVNEAKQVVNLVGAAYRNRNYRARTRVAFQNKSMYGQYRSVGHPVACLVTEGLVDRAARVLGMDPADFRRRNYIPDDAYPWTLTTGPVLERLSQHAALDKLLALMDYGALRAKQAKLRGRGVFRGIGLASFLEMSNPSSATYGLGGASIAARDACTLRLTATGSLACAVGINEIGQGAATMIAQVAASAVGVPIENVRVMLGDTDIVPYGGGNWGSRGTGIGGEAVLQAGKALRANIVDFAARLLGDGAGALDVRGGVVCGRSDGAPRLTLEELARIAYFRTDRVPAGFTPELTVTRSYAQRAYDGICTNGIQASYLEVDAATGFVRLLRHWAVDDCGTIVNPLLVDEQIRGGVVQGIGAALYEQCLYSPEGQLTNGSLMDYLVPMAAEMPDIEVAHIETPTATSELGAKGAGEAGTAGASAAVLNAVNDALAPLGAASISEIPITPERILRALGKVELRRKESP